MNTIINELFNRSLQCCDNGNYQSAVALGKELVDVYQSPLGYYTLGLAYALQENWELAKENCLKAYQYIPQATDSLLFTWRIPKRIKIFGNGCRFRRS